MLLIMPIWLKKWGLIMKKLHKILASLIVFVFFFNFSMLPVLAQEKKVLGVLDFAVVGEEYKGMGTGIAKAIEAEMLKNKSYTVIDTGKIKERIEKSDVFGKDNWFYNTDLIVRAAKGLGFDYLLVGSVMPYEFSYFLPVPIIPISKKKTGIFVDLRLLDVKTQGVLLSMSEKGSGNSYGIKYKKVDVENWAESDSIKAADKLVKLFIKDLNKVNPPVATVLKKENKDVYLEIGVKQGIKKGDRFTLFTQGAEFKSPKTGKVLSVEENILGELKIKSVEEEYSIGELTTTLLLNEITAGQTKARLIVE